VLCSCTNHNVYIYFVKYNKFKDRSQMNGFSCAVWSIFYDTGVLNERYKIQGIPNKLAKKPDNINPPIHIQAIPGQKERVFENFSVVCLIDLDILHFPI